MEKYITNIRYGELGKIIFNYKDVEVTIAEPPDVLLVGVEGAEKWIVEKYGYMLGHVGETQ